MEESRLLPWLQAFSRNAQVARVYEKKYSVLWCMIFFSVIHLGAWTSAFGSPAARMLWRVFAVSATAIFPCYVLLPPTIYEYTYLNFSDSCSVRRFKLYLDRFAFCLAYCMGIIYHLPSWVDRVSYLFFLFIAILGVHMMAKLVKWRTSCCHNQKLRAS